MENNDHTDRAHHDAGLVKDAILHILNALVLKTSKPYILVGGASLILHGSLRITNDIDLLVSRGDSNEFVVAKEAILGGLGYEHSYYIAQIDLLHAIVEPVDIELVKPFTVDIDGVRVPELDVLLGAKIICYHLRIDGEEGNRKRTSDMSDIHWISKEMGRRHLEVRKEVSKLFVCGPYNMLLVAWGLYATFGEQGVKLFESVGGREFECDWGKKEYADQAEYYQVEIEEGGYEEDELKILESRRKPN